MLARERRTELSVCGKESIVKQRTSLLAQYTIQGHVRPKNKISIPKLSLSVTFAVFSIRDRPDFKYCNYYPAFSLSVDSCSVDQEISCFCDARRFGTLCIRARHVSHSILSPFFIFTIQGSF
jgi:hypothetical protein